MKISNLHLRYRLHKNVLRPPGRASQFVSNLKRPIISVHFQLKYILKWPITVVARSKARNVVTRLNTGIVGSNPTSRHGRMSAFVLSCVGGGLATGWSPVQGVLPTSVRFILSDSELEHARGPNLSKSKKNIPKEQGRRELIGFSWFWLEPSCRFLSSR
jgi:hypothetical protein